MDDVLNAALSNLEQPWAGPTIPKIIHQTIRHLPIPEPMRTNAAELADRNPSWEYRLYDEAAVDDFILQHYGAAMLTFYRRIEPRYGAARADLFRYLVVYRLGGVYLDIKSRCNRALDEVLKGDEGFVVSYWSNGPGERYAKFGLSCPIDGSPRGEFQQWHVIAAPGHPFLAAVIRRVLDNIIAYRPWRHETGKRGVLKLTGPVPYTLAIMPLLSRYPCKVVGTEASLSLDYSILPGLNHVGLFRQHYSFSRRSIVRLEGFNRWAGTGFWLLSALANGIKRRLWTARE